MHTNRITDFLDKDHTPEQPAAAPDRFQYDPYGTLSPTIHALNESSEPNAPWTYPVQSAITNPTADPFGYRISDFSTALGRWLKHDPVGCVEGASRYTARM